MQFKTCHYCSLQIPEEANFCPYCTKPTGSRLWIWLRINIGGIIFGALLMGLFFLAAQSRLTTKQGNEQSIDESPAPTEPTAVLKFSPSLVPDIFTPSVEPTITPTFTTVIIPTSTVVVTQIASKDNMVQAHVSAGEFQMGLENGDDRAKPMHAVYLDGYWIDQTEVTNTQYGLCVTVGKCSVPRNLNSQPSDIFYDSQYANHPVVFIDWHQANAYCAWVGRRLPTEAEWEKAARGTDGRIYPWGNELGTDTVNFCDINCWEGWKDKSRDDGYKTTSPVGTYPKGASPYGALDMAGNAYEWVWDWFSQYIGQSQNNPTGPVSGNEHVLRGGSWGDDINHILTVMRSDERPDFRQDFIGFRCAQ